ncbi:MAG TPA: c-type cytochrome [Archangium sp.]|uniref:c-type cytochrome n=1 Tax=Archangium sp. TaxID=1872627 RepID=UPI002EDA88CA
MNVKKMGTTLLALLVGSSAWAAAPKSTPALVEKGKTSYARNCLACHGETGDGNGPTGRFLNPKPRDFKGPFKKGNKPEEIFNTISTGLPGSAMVPFAGLPEEERWALTYYVLSFQPAQGKGTKKDAPPKGKK